ncbi:alpha-1,2-fucosyltransferase [Thalassospira lucentensis]|uniref:alpha-1,2-fucosyltransferase n=1 Tax=Thalassospira lucentensis TaxID=168935 RepID=UPI00399D7371
MAKGKGTVVVGLSGGLGNQIFQYAAGRALSLKLNAPLELDVSWFSKRSDRSYALEPFRVSGRLRRSLPHLPSFFSQLESRVARRYALKRMGVCVYREPHFHFDSAFEAITQPVYIEGYWQSPRYFAKYANIIQDDLCLEKPLPDQCRRVMEDIKNSDAICLHVRRGDYITDPIAARTHGACSLSYYQDGVMRLLGGLSRPKCFLFSDDPHWVRDNINLPCEATVVDINGSDEAHRDLVLMASCRHFVIANSSLSWWAAWLGQAADKRVVAPLNWFKSADKDTSDLIPMGWERI